MISKTGIDSITAQCLSVISALAGLVCVGCGRAGSGLAFTGTITHNGQPVDDGKILFLPSKGSQGPAVGCAFKDGHYRIVASQGLLAGNYEVTITLGGIPKRAGSIRPIEASNSFHIALEIRRDKPVVDIELRPEHARGKTGRKRDAHQH